MFFILLLKGVMNAREIWFLYIHIYIIIINNKCKQVFYNSVWVYNIYTHKQYPVNPIWLLKIEQEQNKKNYITI
jgi:hypothetical protein